MKKFSFLCCSVVALVVLTACGQSGPVKLSLAVGQQDSGENRAVADMSPLAPDFVGVAVEYAVVGTLDAMPATAQAWSVQNYGEAMRETQRIANGLGLDAKAKRSGYDKYVFIAEDKTTGASVTLWNNLALGGWWSYSSAAGQSVSSAPGCPPDDRACVVVPPPAPPANLISADDALARTNEYLTKAKFTPSDYVLTAQTSQWSTDVYGVFQVGGVSSNIALSFSYGENGVLMYASGPMMSVTAADTYPLVSVDEAVQRLSRPQYGVYGSAMRVAADIAVSDTQNSGQNAVPLSIPITSVRLTLMESNLSNGTHMLLPAFTFSNTDGDVGTVIAVTDEYVVFPQTEPPTTDTPGEPEPAPDGQIVPLTDETAQSLVGLSEDEASKVATGNGWAVRIAMRDGEAFSLTMDYRQDRVNLTIEKDRVTKVDIG